VPLPGGARWSSLTSDRTPSRARPRALHLAPVAHPRTPFLGPARQGLPLPIKAAAACAASIFPLTLATCVSGPPPPRTLARPPQSFRHRVASPLS
jgi:hypothetical protein